MRKTNKKGFTIVELVIVIAVIAILAAVLIPTYSSLVKKANLSADDQAVRQMNTALAIYTAENSKPENVGQVQTALRENGVNANAEPVTDGYAYFWDSKNNVIVLVGEGKADTADGYQLLSTNGYGFKPETAVTNAETLKSAITESSLDKPILIKLDSDLNNVNSVEVGQGKCVIFDLNGKTIKGTNSDGNGIFHVSTGGSLTLKNGNIATNGRAIYNEGGNLMLNKVNVTSEVAASATYNDAVFVIGLSQTTIIDSTVKTTCKSNDCDNPSGYALATNSNKTEYDGATITLINSTFETGKDGATGVLINIYANVSIEGCTIKGGKSGMYLRGCVATVKNSTIERISAIASDSDGGFNSGNYGKYGDIILACGGTTEMSGYATKGVYTFENVTAGTGDVFVHIPKGGSVKVSGIEVNHTYLGNDFSENKNKDEYFGYHNADTMTENQKNKVGNTGN